MKPQQSKNKSPKSPASAPFFIAPPPYLPANSWPPRLPAPSSLHLLAASSLRAATLRFYADLNDFLLPEKRQRPVIYTFELSASVKDVIESLGVPHTEVDLILANGNSVDFAYLVQDQDHISVYPLFQSLDIGALTQVRPPALAEARFVLDVHLGRLAGYLRLLGFDALYRNDYLDEELAEISSRENRILLTRDRGLLKRGSVTYGYCLRTTKPQQQLIEVLRRFELLEVVTPFHRCLQCNGLLEPVAKIAVSEQLLPDTRRYYDDFRRCRDCRRIYWKGSHYEHMHRFVEHILAQAKGKKGSD